jgi:hypothetical protein
MRVFQHHPDLCALHHGRFCNTVSVGVRKLAKFGEITGDAFSMFNVCSLRFNDEGFSTPP